MTDEQLPRRGRPRVPDDQACRSLVTVALPTAVHDRLIEIAHRRGDSVSAVVRRLITQRTELTPR